MNAKNLLTIQAVLLVLLIVVVVLGFVLPYVIPPRTASAPALATGLPTEIPISTATSVPIVSTRWEYLTVNYSQGTNFADNPINSHYEVVIVDREPYASQFNIMLYEGCDGVMGDIAAEMNCVSGNFKGREYFLHILGQDGWELVQIDNQSSQYTYQIDMVFKRPAN